MHCEGGFLDAGDYPSNQLQINVMLLVDYLLPKGDQVDGFFDVASIVHGQQLTDLHLRGLNYPGISGTIVTLGSKGVMAGAKAQHDMMHVAK
eukprot:scaffold63399_cov22-Tisochrysis_lutea.AAC.2